MFLNNYKKDLNYDKTYCIYPRHIEITFIKLLHLLSDESILLTFNEREILYKKINFIIDFLEKAKNNGKDN